MVLFGATLYDHDRRPSPPTMQSQLRLLAFVTLFLGCATGSGEPEDPIDEEDAGGVVERDEPVALKVDAPPVDPGPSCPAPALACGGGCVDTRVSQAHCGGCGRACGFGETCAAGACQSACAPPRTTCGSACVDRSTDVTHCGACGNRCATGQSCVAGACRSPTPATTVGLACSPRVPTCGDLLWCMDWPGGYCTDYCFSDSHCGPDGLCISTGLNGFCGRVCTASSQCRAGYRCYRISDTQGACMPL